MTVPARTPSPPPGQTPPGTPLQRSTLLSQMRSDTQVRIEKAVLDLFSRRDFHEVGLIDVARAANVSLQTIYQ